MRCRKARSFLSAYCRDELDSRRKLAVREHLSTCSDCRREEARLRQVVDAAGDLPQLAVSDDFNTRLLNRIAQERFAETRSKAYLPKEAPAFLWRSVAPALVAACMAVFVVVGLMSSGDNITPAPGAERKSLDDSYLTVQPVDNPNMTVNLNKNWSLDDQLARVERISRISRTIMPASSFGAWDNSGRLARAASMSSGSMSYGVDYYRVRPVVKVYVSPQRTTNREDSRIY